MPDELPETPPPVTTPPAVVAQQPTATASVLDQPEVKAAIAAEAERVRNATWKQARESMSKKPGHEPPTTQQPTSQPTTSTATQGMTPQDFLRISAFTAAASEIGIPPRGIDMLLERVMTEKPADVRAWTATEAAEYGWKKATTTTTTTTTPTPTTNAPATQANAHPVTSTASPADPTRVTDDTPLMSLSESDRLAFLQRKGIVEYTDRIKQEARRSGARISLRR